MSAVSRDAGLVADTESQSRPDQALMDIGPGVLSGRKAAVRPRWITRCEREVDIGRPPSEVFEFCLHAENIRQILPDRAEPVPGTRLVGEPGGVYAFRHWIRNRIPVLWVVRIERFERDREFVDLAIRGAFRYFRHTHTCLPIEGGTRYRDSVEFATRLGPLFDRLFVRRELDRTFAHRQHRMRELLER